MSAQVRNNNRSSDYLHQPNVRGNKRAYKGKPVQLQEKIPNLVKDTSAVLGENFWETRAVLEKGVKIKNPDDLIETSFQGLERQSFRTQAKKIDEALKKRQLPQGLGIKKITKIKGHGVFAIKKRLLKGTVVGPYTGVITKRNRADVKSLYVMDYSEKDPTMVVDAATKGNFTRLLNHSKKANCRVTTVKMETNELPQVYVITDTVVHKGNELLLNYGDDYFKKAGITPLELA